VTPRISVIVPAYNEEERIESTLPRILEQVPSNCELLLVDDGSTDRTAAIAAKMMAEHGSGTVIHLPWNQGKGAAVRVGVAHATGDPIVFLDADLSVDLTHLDQVAEHLADADVVIGSRMVADSEVHRGSGRAAAGKAFNRVARALTGVEAADTQCGFKVFRRDAAKLLFGMQQLNGFAFDVELLTLAKHLRLRVKEVPVRWISEDGSKIRWSRDPLSMVVDVMKVGVRHGRSRFSRNSRLSTGWREMVMTDDEPRLIRRTAQPGVRTTSQPETRTAQPAAAADPVHDEGMRAAPVGGQ
jgi:dolichyl-phosphate beta-glucosyltransferase